MTFNKEVNISIPSGLSFFIKKTAGDLVLIAMIRHAFATKAVTRAIGGAGAVF